jgi:hypothetical protein
MRLSKQIICSPDECVHSLKLIKKVNEVYISICMCCDTIIKGDNLE